MRKIDTYIIKSFLSIFLFTLILFTLVSIAIHTSEKIDAFIRSGLGPWGIMTDYYAGFLPYILILTFPIIVFLSVIVLTSRMAVHSEIIAIRASGISYLRFLIPFMASGILLMMVHWILINFILPEANKIRTDFDSKYASYNPNRELINDYYSNLHLRSDKNTFVTFKNYSTYRKSASGFFIDKIKDHELKQRITGKKIQWQEDSLKWKGTDIIIKENFKSSTVKETKVDEIYFNFSFTPNDAVLDDFFKDKLYRHELKDYIRKEKTKGANTRNLQLELYKRDATPIMMLILPIIGVMLASKKVKGGRGMHISIGIVLMAIYTFFDKISSILAVKTNFPPILAAWTPHIVFGIITMYIYYVSKKD